MCGCPGVHASHNLQTYKGLKFCKACGSYFGKRIDNLAHECKKPTLAGARNIRYIKMGKLPVGKDSWPDDDLVLYRIQQQVADLAQTVPSNHSEPSSAQSLVQTARDDYMLAEVQSLSSAAALIAFRAAPNTLLHLYVRLKRPRWHAYGR